MGLVKQYLCDNCGEIMYGKKGVGLVHKTYRSIRGSITVQRWNNDRNQGEFVYISEHPEEPMCFCNTACFKEFAEFKCNEWDKGLEKAENLRLARLREEAEVDYKKRKSEGLI